VVGIVIGFVLASIPYLWNGNDCGDNGVAGFISIGDSGVYVRQGVVENMTTLEFIWDGNVQNYSQVEPFIREWIDERGYEVKAMMYLNTGYAVAYVEEVRE